MRTVTDSILIVDDDEAVAKVLSAGLADHGIAAVSVSSADEALRLLRRRMFGAVLSDVRMPGISGMELLPALRDQWPETPFILLTAHGTVAMAVEAMKGGAMDFLTKPFDLDEVVAVARRALSISAAQAKKVPSIPVSASPLASRSSAMKQVDAILRRAAESDCTVLLTGESGTGKEIAARFLHDRSARVAGPFVPIQCAALPENLLESELFGYEKGAFTGAAGRKPGRLELAAGGTVFLDEIGELSGATQVKLLRVLQEKTFEHLGGLATVKANVRFIAATHRDLVSMVRDGGFREDLYYRLNVCPVHLPPLRERREDIVPLVEHFAQIHSAGRRTVSFDADALQILARQSWPGNIRQLQNFVERMVVLCEGPAIDRESVLEGLRPAGCSAQISAPSGVDATLDSSRREAERQAVKTALERSAGNRTQAARLLGVSRRTLYNKLADLSIA
jgi:two-component system response regulator AtoC